MTLSRQQRHHLAACARYNAGKNKPLERRRVQSFLSPITRAFNQMMTGYVDTIRGYAVTRLAHKDEWERTDECLNGVISAMTRLFPDLDLQILKTISTHLFNGTMMEREDILSAKRLLKEIEDRMIKKTWQQVMDATQTTQIEIHMEQLGFKEAA